MADPKGALAALQKKYGATTTNNSDNRPTTGSQGLTGTANTGRATGSAEGAKNALASLQQKYSAPAAPRPTTGSAGWTDVEAAQTEMEGWASRLTAMERLIGNKRTAAERAEGELQSAYSEVQRLQADTRLGSDPILQMGYQNTVNRYNTALSTYQVAAKEHDDLVTSYNDLLGQYETGYNAYKELLANQANMAADYRAKAEAAEQEATTARNVLVGLNRYGTQAQKDEYTAKAEAAEALAAEMREKAEAAEGYYYSYVPLMDDYAQYSAAGPAKREADDLNMWKFWQEKGDDLYDFINDLKLDESEEYGYRQTVELLSLMAQQQDKYGAYTAYSHMTPDEIGIYNYIYATRGKEDAEAFLDELMNTLNYRMGAEEFENLTGVGKALYWIPAGVDQFAGGMAQLFSEEALPTSPIQFTSGMVSQEAHDKSELLGFAYDLGTTVSNMAPSILLSYLSAGMFSAAGLSAGAAGHLASGIGSTTLGLSAGGNAYKQKVDEGYTPEEARAYATLIGASEAGLQYLLGGIGSLGGVSAEKVAVKVAGIDNALARIALNLGTRMTLEGVEEGLQEVLAPAFATLVLGEEYEVNFEDVAYAYLMGAITAGLLEGGSVVSAELHPGTDFVVSDLDGYKTEGGVDYFEGCETLEEVEAKYYELARQNHPDLGGSQDVMADINRQHDMQKAFFQGAAQGQTEGQTQAALPPLATQEAATAPQTAENVAGIDVGNIRETAPAAPVTRTEQENMHVAPVTEAEPQGLSLPTLEPETQQQTGLPPLTRPVQGAPAQTPAADIQNGGVTNEFAAGENLSDGDPGRLYGPRPGEQAGGVGQGARSAARTSEQFRAASARQDRVNALRQDKVSSRDLGITQGTDAKIVQVAPEETWDDGMRATAERVYRETGMNVTYVIGGLQVATPDGARLVRGVYTGSGIIIQADNMRYSTDQIADHEIFHDKAYQTPGLVADIEARIIERFGREEFARAVDTYLQRLRGVIDVPADASPDQIEAAVRDVLEEIMADAYAGINAFSANAPRYGQTVEEVAEERGVGRTRETAAATDRTTGPPQDRYSYAGRNANRANSETLAEAERMEMQGADPETIRQETGWFRGADELWRWEIDDSGMEYDVTGNMRDAVDKGKAFQAMNEAWERLENAVTDKQHEVLREYLKADRAADQETKQALDLRLTEEVGTLFTEWAVARNRFRWFSDASEGGKLADYISHPELFANYPQLRNATLRFENMEDGVQGYFDPATGDIALDVNLRYGPEDVLIHEIQHAIQRAEGFARGSNREYWQRQLDEGYDARTAEERRTANEYRAQLQEIQETEPAFYADMMELNAMAPDMPRGKILDWDTLEAEPDPPEWQRYDERLEEMERQYGDRVFSFVDLLYQAQSAEGRTSRMAYDLYRDTAGEIEARDVARRRTMAPEQRRQTPPDTGNEDTVFVEEDVDSFAAEPVEDNQGRELTPEQAEFFKDSQIRDTRGHLLTLYHQTEGEFTVFDTRHEGAGTRDNGTPFGIFMKTSADDIGLRGQRQMELYANITNPLQAYSREGLTRALEQLSPEYSALLAEHKALDNEYHERFETAKRALREFMFDWRKNNPGAGRTALYDVPEFNTLYAAEDAVIEEWTAKADELSRRAKEALTQALRTAGYDGVILARDAGSFGRSTDAYIALDPEQVKNVTNRAPTSDPDIRFSVDELAEAEYNTLTEREDVLLGDTDETYTQGNRAVEFEYAIVPAEALIVSNDQYGSANPAYPAELQPRDRGRVASQVQIQSMSRSLNPRLLEANPTAQNGAPIVRGDGAVVGGNARTQAIITAYENGTAAEYEKFIRQRGRRYGIDTTNMPKNPVLVRVARNVPDWAALAQDLNAATTASYSATEQAMSDAKKMEGILELIVPNDEGTINNVANREFINQFMQQVVPESERGSMTTSDGMLSQAGLERAQYAIFAYAYGDPVLLEKLSESLDNDNKNVTKALLDTAASAVSIRAGIEAGTLYDLKVVDNVLHAVQIYTEAKRQKMTVQEYTDQLSVLEGFNGADAWIAQFIEDNKRSGKQIRTMLNALYDTVQDYGDPQQVSMFGGEEHGLHETIDGAIRRYEEQTGRGIGRPDFGRFAEDGAVAGGRPAAGGEVSLPGVESADPGRGESPGADEGRAQGVPEAEPEPEGLSLPTLEEPAETAAAPAPEREIPPAPDYAEQLRRRLMPEPAPAEEGRGDLYRDPDMTDEEYAFLNERWHENERLRQAESYESTDAFIADAEARAEAAKAERMKNISKEDFIGTPSLQKLGVKVENSVGIYQFIKSLIANDKAAKSIRKEMRKAERRLGATEAERNFASGVAAGVYTEADIPASMDADKVMELADYYWAEKAVAADMIRAQRADINRALSEKMEELFKDSDKFKPSKAVILNNRTPERNMLKIFGDERGAAINAAIFDPVAANEAERYRFRNRMHNEVRTFQDSKGKQTRLTKEERAIVQQVIEGRAVGEIVAGMEMRAAIENAAENIRNGADVADAATEFGLGTEERRLAEKYSRWMQTQADLESGKVDNVKVENAVKKYTELFDQFYEAINDFLVAHGYEPIGFIKGYAPHLQPESNQTVLNKSLQALGINTDVTRLPTSIAGLTADYKPNKRWNPYFLQRTSDITQYDIASAFESYVDYMSDVLYHTDDIMRVRQAANYFRRTYAPDEIRENLSWAEELRFGKTEEKANFLRDHDVISRTSAMSAADVNQAMDEYVAQLYEDITNTTKYSELVSYLDNYANILAGKQSMADRGWEYSGGRTILNVGNKLVRAFGRAQVAGNLSSALNQTAQLPMITAELGARYTTAAIRDIWSGKLRRAGWAEGSDFLVGKHGIDYLVMDPGEMVISALFTPAQLMDGFMSTIAVRGKYLKEINAGKAHAEAMKAADQFAKSIMASRMKGSRPLAYDAKNPVSQMLHVFQTEVVNQWEHLSQDLPRDFRKIEAERGKGAAARATAGVIVKMLIAAFLLNRLDEELYGGTPAPFDILGLSANFVASGEGLTTNEWLRTVIDNGWAQLTGERLFDTDASVLGGEFDWNAAVEDASFNVGNDIPFLRNAMGLLGLGDETLPMPDIYGSITSIVDAIKNDGLLSGETGAAFAEAVAEFLPGGRQMLKTGQGLDVALRGGYYRGYGDDRRLQYPVEGDAWDILRAALFGRSAMPESDAFWASGDSGLSVKQTQLYDDMVADGADGMEIYGAIQDYRAINGDDTLTSYERGLQERNLIRGLSITDQQKLALYQGLTGADSRVEKFRALMDRGMTWDQVMDAYDKYAELDANEEMTAGEQAAALATWADAQGYTAEQKATIKDQLKFFSIVPAEATRYEALTGAGLDPGAAYGLTNTLAGLQPEEGNAAASDMQRLEAINAADLSQEEKISAMGTIMGTELTTESGGKSQYAMLLEAVDAGYTLDDYLALKGAGLMTESSFGKVQISGGYGISADQFIQYREALVTADAMNADPAKRNESIDQSETAAAINGMLGLNNEQKAVLWQLQNKSWKADKNPFSPSVGAAVKAAMESGEMPGLTLPGLGGTAEAPAELPGLSLPSLG